MSKLLYHKLSNQVLNVAFYVHNKLGPGLVESIYHKAMIIEFTDRNIPFESEKPFPVVYKNQNLGCFYSDLIIENKIIIEIKSVKALNETMAAQTINYLCLSGLHVGYLLNFRNPLLEWKRYYRRGS